MAWPPPPANGETDLGLGVDPLSPSPPGTPPGGPPIGPGQPWPPPAAQSQPGAGPYPQPGYDQPQAYPPTYQSPLRTKSGRNFTKRQKILFLILSILAAFLVIWTLFSNMGVESAPPPTPQTASAEAGEAAPSTGEALAQPPQADVLNLIFLKEQNTHHYVTHPEAGQLLVIVGRIRNGYDKPISHIRVKGSLKNSDNQILSERQVFAGNYLSEEILKSLSMREILARLSLRGGENGSNLNIQPGQDVPFMLVFDKLPPDVAEYIVEPLDYTPVETAG
ncbi:MAG: DUF3426 domain-containing protein [Deltaproteobacteria bacterium]|nr:DUF3426 domain-containing protein [Deltaproteobacteria bacterium]